MTTAEKLKRIKLRCKQLLANDFRPDTSLPGGLPSVTHALAKSTIAAIETCRAYDSEALSIQAQAIIAAWPEELL